MICSASLSFKLNEDKALSMTSKQFSSNTFLQVDSHYGLAGYEIHSKSVFKCSLILVGKWCLRTRTYLYIAKDIRSAGNATFYGNKLFNLKSEKNNFDVGTFTKKFCIMH